VTVCLQTETLMAVVPAATAISATVVEADRQYLYLALKAGIMAALVVKIKEHWLRFRTSRALQSTVWYTGGTAAEKLLGFGLFVVLARLLQPETLGVYAVVISWAQIFLVLFSLNLTRSIHAAFFDFDKAQFDQFISSILTLGALGILILGGGFVGLLQWQPTLMGASTPYMPLVLLWVLGLFVMEVSEFKWRLNYVYRVLTLTRLGRLLAQYVVGIGLLLYSSIDPIVALVGVTVVTYAIPGWTMALRLLNRGRRYVDLTQWRYAVAMSLPLLFGVLAHNVMSRADQIMILQINGETDAGIYSVAYRFGEVAFLVWVATGSVWTVWFKEQLELGHTEKIRRIGAQYAIGFAGVMFALIGLGAVALLVLIPAEYHIAVSLIPPIAASGFFAVLQSLYHVIEYYNKNSFQIAIFSVVAALFNVVLNAWLLPRFGFPAAAWTTLATYAALFAMYAAHVELRLQQRYVNTTLNVGLGVAVAALVVLLSYLLETLL
jgi:O-antigen/teichoic acid export membrane protein